MLFGGTVHYNLDPFSVYNDTEIWRALEQVLKDRKLLNELVCILQRFN